MKASVEETLVREMGTTDVETWTLKALTESKRQCARGWDGLVKRKTRVLAETRDRTLRLRSVSCLLSTVAVAAVAAVVSVAVAVAAAAAAERRLESCCGSRLPGCEPWSAPRPRQSDLCRSVGARRATSALDCVAPLSSRVRRCAVWSGLCFCVWDASVSASALPGFFF